MRKLTKALTVVSLLAPVSGYPLGIGDIRVRSALNQNLNAEINLVASRGENPSNIKVSLASADKFDEAGIPWTYFLSKLRFQPVVKANGAMVIKVTSREALKEPYLNFLLEVSWPKGNLYREFTVLVDPPADYQHPSYQEPVYQEPIYPSASTYDVMPRMERQEYVPRRRSVRPARSARVHADKPRRIAAGNYGGQVVTRRNDTLWNVAERARGAGVSVEQMMMALYDQNPQAFYQQNVNALSAGKTLRIPEKSSVEQKSRQDALAEFSRHNEAWNTNRSGIPRNESQVASEETVDTQLKLEAPTEATVGAEETVAPSGEQAAGSQKASTPASQAVTGQDAGKEKAQVDKALQDKINALEKQMANMEQLIALKDKQLAELQNPSKETPPTQPQATATTPTAPVQPETTTAPPPVTAQPVPTPPVQATPEPPKPVQPVVPPKPVVKPPVSTQVQPAPIPEESSPLPWILGLTGITFAALFGWLWWRKQKILKETDAESMFRNYTTMRNTESSGGLSTTMRKASSTLTAGAGESSFLNDFKASDFESFESFNVDHSDIDPVAEADVYLAYGRYQQAEDLMKDAIKQHPEREDCKLKLLEIYQASSNKTAFESYSKELADAGKKDNVNFWAKVILLARDISTDTELFSHSAQSNEAVFPTGAESVSENVLFDVSNFIPDTEAVSSAKTIPDTEHLGAATFEVDESEGEGAVFELTEPELPAVQDLQEPPTPKEEKVSSGSSADQPNVLAQRQSTFDDENKVKDFQDNDSLDFDLGPYPSGKASNQTRLASDDVSATIEPTNIEFAKPNMKEDLESYDFDFDNDFMGKGTAPQVPENAQSEAWDSSQTLDFTLDGLPESDAEDNTINFNFELDAIPETDAAKPDNDDFSVAELTDMDEMETKLDLAKAYVDMGDADSAKDIIMQVIQNGSPEQKKSAQSLLDELGMSG